MVPFSSGLTILCCTSLSSFVLSFESFVCLLGLVCIVSWFVCVLADCLLVSL